MVQKTPRGKGTSVSFDLPVSLRGLTGNQEPPVGGYEYGVSKVRITSIPSISLVPGALLSLSKDGASRRTATSEIVPAAILRDGSAKSAASSG